MNDKTELIPGLKKAMEFYSELGFEYLPVKKEIDFAEPLLKNEKERFENCVVILTSIEKGDDESLIEDFIKEPLEYLKKIQCNSVLIYPYAHLSNNLWSARIAKEFLEMLKQELVKEGLEVEKSPFGWYKRFTIQCKGHPIAESFREY